MVEMVEMVERVERVGPYKIAVDPAPRDLGERREGSARKMARLPVAAACGQK